MLLKTKVAKKLVGRRSTVVLAIGVLAGLAVAPSGAQAGFLDQLFGVFQAPVPAAPPSYDYGRAPSTLPSHYEHRHVRKRVAVVSDKPVLQKTTALMEDRTLRQGDAVMLKDGLHVYAGPEASTHDRDQFVPLDQARHVPQKERTELALLDTTRNDPLKHMGQPDTIASGRSASVGSPIVAGYRITDAKGASVRYVGP